MKFKYIYILSLVLIITLYFINSLVQKIIFVLLFIIIELIYKIKFKFKIITFGLYFSIFITLFNWFITTNISIALIKGADSLLTFIAILQISLVLKHFLSIKQIAYCITKSFAPFKVFGFNQNYFYTIILLSLNQIYYLAADAQNLYAFTIIEMKANRKIKRAKVIIDLIIPFIFTSLKKNQIITISILNKGYNMNETKLVILNYEDVDNKIIVIMMIIVALNVLMMGVL